MGLIFSPQLSQSCLFTSVDKFVILYKCSLSPQLSQSNFFGVEHNSFHVLAFQSFPNNYHMRVFLVLWMTLCFSTCAHFITFPLQRSHASLFCTVDSIVFLYMFSPSPAIITIKTFKYCGSQYASLHMFTFPHNSHKSVNRLTAPHSDQAPAESLTGPVHRWEVIPARQPRRD